MRFKFPFSSSKSTATKSPATPISREDLLSDPSLEQVLSANEEYRQKIIQRILDFPFDEYEIYTVKGLGKFYLDDKPDWIKDVLKKNHLWEGYLLPFIKKYVKPGTTVIDAGSHIGTHTFSLAQAVQENGKVIAFEPQPKTFSELFMNKKISGYENIECFWGALGDKQGEIELPNFYPQVEVTCVYDFANGHSGQYAPMIPLDSLNLSNISLMKVDVDGCDEIFLRGC